MELYPTPPMMEAVASLYAKIMQFLLKAVQWYKEKPIKHAIGAVLKPWALSYKDIREEIWELSRQVDRLASMAAKAEIRGVHAVVLRAEERAILAEEQARIQIEAFRALPATLVAAQAPQLRQLLQLAIESKSMQQVVLSSQTEFFLESNRNHILSGCFLELPTSGTSLEYCSSIRDRRILRPKLRLPEISVLERWASNPSLTMVFTKSFSSEAEKDFLVGLVHLIRASGLPVIWTLRYSGYWKAKITCIDILRMLVIQALEINPQALCGPLPITMTSLRQAADQDNWLQILNRALEGIPQVYVVIDAEILGLATEHNRLRATKWIELLPRHISSTRIKLIVSSSNLKESYMSTQWKPESWIRLRTDYHNNRGMGQLRRRNRRTRRARRDCP